MRSLLIAAALASVAGTSSAQVVYNSNWDNGFFLGFDSSTPAGVRYGDSGWLGNGPAVALDSIRLGLVVYNGGPDDIDAGTIDMNITFNDGDASGMVFGPGTALKTVNLNDVEMPALASGQLSVFPVQIPLNGISTSGGFNNVGFAIGTSDFGWDGSLGFQCATGMTVGFYTNNYSYFNGSTWQLYSLDPIGQFIATIYGAAPSPGAASLLGVAGLVGLRRRR